METFQGTNWLLELLRLAVPVAASIGVGLWINKANEKYKNELAKEIHRYQTFHQRQSASLEELFNETAKIEEELTRALNIVENIHFYYGNEEHQESELTPVAQRAFKLIRDLKAKFVTARIFMDAETCDFVEKLIENFDTASGLFIRRYVEETDESYILAKEVEGRKQAEELVRATIPKLKSEFEKKVRTILSA